MEDLSKPVYIRRHIDIPTDKLAKELGESYYYVWLCKEVARNEKLRASNSGRNKYNNLTPKMRDWLANSSDDWTREELAYRFNSKFQGADITPIQVHALIRYRRRVRGSRKERN